MAAFRRMRKKSGGASMPSLETVFKTAEDEVKLYWQFMAAFLSCSDSKDTL